MNSAYYLMVAANKWLLISKSRGDSNWCTPCRENLINTTCTLFMSSPRTPPIRFMRAVPIHGNLWRWVNEVGRILPLLRKRAPVTMPSTPADWSTCPPLSFSLLTSIKIVGLRQSSVDEHATLVYWVSYIQHVISTFNTYSWIPTSRSLINTDGGYKLEGASFPQHSPRSFQPTVLRFPLRVPPGLRLNILMQIVPTTDV
jgi:hypothetical protein